MIDFDRKMYSGQKYEIMDVVVNDVSIDGIKDIRFNNSNLLILTSLENELFYILKNDLKSFYATFMNEDGTVIGTEDLDIIEYIHRYMTVKQIVEEIAEHYIIDHIEPDEEMIEMTIHDTLSKFRLDIKERVIAILEEYKK